MIKSFQLGEDGSLTIQISSDSPGKDAESNWLPAPRGPFYMVFRLYMPKQNVLEGKWTPPKVEVSKQAAK